jgi:hypothetical protein
VNDPLQHNIHEFLDELAQQFEKEHDQIVMA